MKSVYNTAWKDPYYDVFKATYIKNKHIQKYADLLISRNGLTNDAVIQQLRKSRLFDAKYEAGIYE